MSAQSHGHAHGLVHGAIRRSREGLRAVGIALRAVAAAGAIGFGGNLVAAWVRTRAGRRLDSPAPTSPIH